MDRVGMRDLLRRPRDYIKLGSFILTNNKKDYLLVSFAPPPALENTVASQRIESTKCRVGTCPFTAVNGYCEKHKP